jgi:5'-nucleotidase
MSILHSGTVGAAMTAASSGVGALAFSIDASGDVHWRTAQRVATAILGWFDSSMPQTLLNINVPNVEATDLLGLRVATLAPFGAVTAIVTERGQGHVTLDYRAPDEEATPGTDVALISEGFATVTALAPVCAREADLGGLVEAVNSAR